MQKPRDENLVKLSLYIYVYTYTYIQRRGGVLVNGSGKYLYIITRKYDFYPFSLKGTVARYFGTMYGFTPWYTFDFGFSFTKIVAKNRFTFWGSLAESILTFHIIFPGKYIGTLQGLLHGK